jgi:hypothetical protein
MLTDHYAHIVQKARQREMLGRAEERRLADSAISGRRLQGLLQRSICWLPLPTLRTVHCPVHPL